MKITAKESSMLDEQDVLRWFKNNFDEAELLPGSDRCDFWIKLPDNVDRGKVKALCRDIELTSASRIWNNSFIKEYGSILVGFKDLTAEPEKLLERNAIGSTEKNPDNEGQVMNENTKITLTIGQLKKLVRESVVNEHWNMVSKNLETGKLKCHGEYPSRKCGLQYAPEILDLRLKEDAGCDDIDLRDDLIGDFMEAQGKKSVRFGNYVYFLAKNVFNAYGDVKNDPIVPEPVDDEVKDTASATDMDEATELTVKEGTGEPSDELLISEFTAEWVASGLNNLDNMMDCMERGADSDKRKCWMRLGRRLREIADMCDENAHRVWKR